MENDWIEGLFDSAASKSRITELMHELSAARTARKYEDVADFLGLLGREYRLRDRYSEAIRYLEDSRLLFKRLGNANGQAWCMREQGQVFIALRDFDKAEPLVTQARAIYHATGEASEEAYCITELGLIERWRRNFDTATRLFHEAYDLACTVNASLIEAYCLHELGIIEHRLGNYEAALDRLRLASARYNAIEDRTGRANVAGDMGCVLIDLKRWIPAAKLLGESLHIHRETGNTLGIGINCFNLGWLNLRRGAPEAAKSWAKRAQAAFASQDVSMPDFGRELLQELGLERRR